MKSVLILLAVLLLLTAGCQRSAPTINEPSTTTTTAATRYTGRLTTGGDTTTTGTPADNTTTTRESSTSAVNHTTTSTTVPATTTTAAREQPSVTAMRQMGFMAQMLGSFDSVDDIPPENVARALYVYGVIKSDAFSAYTTVSQAAETVCVPMETVDALCRRFFDRTYDMRSLSASMFEDTIRIECDGKFLNFTKESGFGVDNEFMYICHEQQDQTVKVTLYDAAPMSGAITDGWTKIDGQYYEISGKYLLTLRKVTEGYQFVSLSPL